MSENQSTSKLMTERKFYPIFWAQFCGVFAENFFKTALVILIAFRSATVFGISSSEVVLIANGIMILPFVLFSAFAGQLADKYEKSALVRNLKNIDIVILCVAAAFLMVSNYEALLVVLFIKGVQAAIFGPVRLSILPQHLNENEYVTGYAYLNAGAFLAILTGSILGGVLILLPNGAEICSLVMLVFAIAGIWVSRRIPVAAAVAPELKIDANIVRSTWQVLGFARETRRMFFGVTGIGWFWYIAASYFSLFPLLSRDLFHGNENLATLLMTVFSVGTAVGSVLCERLSGGRIELRLVSLGALGISVTGGVLAWLCWARSIPTEAVSTLSFVTSLSGAEILAALFILPIFGGFFIVPMYVMIQTEGKPGHRAQIIGASNILNAVFMVLAAGSLVGFLQLGLSFSQIFVVLSILNLVFAGIMLIGLPEFLSRKNDVR